jgi:hypothetical protein
MGAALAWFTTVVILLAGILALHQLGVNVASMVSSSLHSIEQALGQPLLP